MCIRKIQGPSIHLQGSNSSGGGRYETRRVAYIATGNPTILGILGLTGSSDLKCTSVERMESGMAMGSVKAEGYGPAHSSWRFNDRVCVCATAAKVYFKLAI